MKKGIAAALTGALLGATISVPAQAEQSELWAFLFGRDYKDGVRAVSISEGVWEDERHPSYFAFPARIRVAQSRVMADPSLQEALARRNIKVHNVLWVETAANGGRIIYYR